MWRAGLFFFRRGKGRTLADARHTSVTEATITNHERKKKESKVVSWHVAIISIRLATLPTGVSLN